LRLALWGVSITWSEFLFVSKLNYPLMWFMCIPEFYRLQNLGSIWLSSSPFALWIPWALGFSACNRPRDRFGSLVFILSYTSTPLQRFSSKLAVLWISKPHFIASDSKYTSLELFYPSAFPDLGALFFTNPFGSGPKGFAFPLGSSRLRVWLPSLCF
jgi:hypothetical protein